MTALEDEALCDEVARTVMGWHSLSIPWAYSQTAVCWAGAEGAAIIAQPAWRPDERDAQCMRVLDRMVALGFSCTLEVGAECARAAFGRGGAYREAIEHPSRRVALLRAAVLAAGGE